MVVDGGPLSARVATLLRARGVSPVHVTSEVTDIGLGRGASEGYTEEIAFDGDMRRLLALLAPRLIAAVLSPSERGRTVAEALAAALGLPGNPPELSDARGDKWQQAAQLTRCGISTADTAVAPTQLDAIAFTRGHPGQSWVLKPARGLASEGVYVCADEGSLCAAFAALTTPNSQLSPPPPILVQSFLRGPEFVVSTVSCDGHHRTSSVFHYTKRLASWRPIYEYMDLVGPDHPLWQGLISCAFRALDALGLRYGAAHTEIIYTDAGPVVVEVNARPIGTINSAAHDACLGFNQLDLMAEAALEPVRFLSRQNPPPRRRMRRVFLINDRAGTVTSSPIAQLLPTLLSYFATDRLARPGAQLCATHDVFSSPGVVTLVHEDTEQIERDYALIRGWEPRAFEWGPPEANARDCQPTNPMMRGA